MTEEKELLETLLATDADCKVMHGDLTVRIEEIHQRMVRMGKLIVCIICAFYEKVKLTKKN